MNKIEKGKIFLIEVITKKVETTLFLNSLIKIEKS